MRVRRLLSSVVVAVVLAGTMVYADVYYDVSAQIAACKNPDIDWWGWFVNSCWMWNA
jgi:hypothetical protein